MPDPSESLAPTPRLLATGWTQRLATAVARPLARWYLSLEVKGLEHLPSDEPVLLCANHASHADTYVLACGTQQHSRRLVFLAARDYFFEHRWRSQLIRRLICLMPFERGHGMAAAKHNLHLLAMCRDARRIIVLFPEGTRSPDGRMREFKPGAALFAEKLAMRVVPCRLEGTYDALPKGTWFPRPRRVRLSFGPPLAIPPPPPGEDKNARLERYAQFTAELQRQVCSLGEPAKPAEAVLAR